MDSTTFYAVILSVALLGAVSLINTSDIIELKQQNDLYCEMVGIYKETKGKYGWPDYKGIAGEVCK